MNSKLNLNRGDEENIENSRAKGFTRKFYHRLEIDLEIQCNMSKSSRRYLNEHWQPFSGIYNSNSKASNGWEKSQRGHKEKYLLY